jgi:hypothetical protein
VADRKQRVIVTVREGAIVYHDGHAHHGGAQLEVPVAEAKALVEQGVITKTEPAPARPTPRPHVT